MYQWLRKIDGFRSLPRELTESTAYGGWFSIASMIIIVFLFFSELLDFLTPSENVTMKMQKFDKESLFVHFDVTMFAIDCDHTNLLVFDAFRESEMEVKSSLITRTPVATNGTLLHDQSYTRTHDDPPLVSRFQKSELDWDWDVSSKVIKSGIKFKEVLKAHDFTFLNFYADWCSHCKAFSNTWNAVETESDKLTYTDADGNELKVKLLRVNCVEFPKECQQQSVRYYPTVRMYRPDETFTVYEGERSHEDLMAFIKRITENSHHSSWSEDSDQPINGCRMTGSIEILRVPSEFHFQVKAQDKSLVPSLTNVSHEVHRLVYADSDIDAWSRLSRKLPWSIASNLNPLGGKKFITNRKNQSPQHFFQVVSTNYHDSLIYQVTAQSHLKEEDRHAVPKAKFSYTISPLTVEIGNTRKPFYQFLTSVCALLGGAYTIIKVLFGATDFVAKKMKRHVGKLG